MSLAPKPYVFAPTNHLLHIFLINYLSMSLAPEPYVFAPTNHLLVHQLASLVVEGALIHRHGWAVVVANLSSLSIFDRVKSSEVPLLDGNRSTEDDPVDSFFTATSSEGATVVEIFIQVERKEVGNIHISYIKVVQSFLAKLGIWALKMIFHNLGKSIHANCGDVSIILDKSK